MNLENLGVQELNATEVKSVDGGTWYQELMEGFNAGTGQGAAEYRGVGWYSFGYGLGVSAKQ